MTDHRDAVQFERVDHRQHRRRVIPQRIVTVIGLFRLAETFQIDRNDHMIGGQSGADFRPREAAGAEPMDQEDWRAVASYFSMEMRDEPAFAVHFFPFAISFG